jgi:phage-related protein
MISPLSPNDKPIAWLVDTVRTPPFGREARIAVGYLLRCLQAGMTLSMPESRPVPSVGARCHELRVEDPETRRSWRLIYRIDADAIVAVEWFNKTTRRTPQAVITRCQQRLRAYDEARRG